MLRYKLRRPSPIQVQITRTKRQDAGLGAIGPGSEAEEPEGPESPESPGSSPSTTGAPSPGDSSDSDDDEPPSPTGSSSPSTGQVLATSTLASNSLSLSSNESRPTSITSNQPAKQPSTQSSTQPSSRPSSQTSSSASNLPTQTSSTSTSASSPAFTQTATSRGIGAVAPPPPEITSTSTTAVTSARTNSTTSTISPISPTTTSSQIFSSKIARPTQLNPTTVSISPTPPPGFTGSPVSENDPPRRTRPEPTLMSKGAEAAAITLSIIGAIALVVGILLYCKRRRRRRNEKLEAELERDAANYAALHATETAHANNSVSPFASSGPHMTQSTDRSNTLFGPGSYSRPETVSTRGDARDAMPQRTPNPFADPPLNKAYDVLAGRPRSTTLTDRGSWIKNPFKDPESERFDPFGELQAKARRERVKQVELARREAELQRQFEQKEKMGLTPPERPNERNGSGVTFDGLGVLDRSGAGAYR